MQQYKDYFTNTLAEWGYTLNDKQFDQFVSYYEMLIETNKVMNLTSITEPKAVVSKHFLDSVALLKYVDLQSTNSLIDIGTGAGFPGIPLKILFPDLKVTLLDSLNKRVKFLQSVIEELGLDQSEAVHGRAEEFARKNEYREKFELCVSRAVANLATLSELCLPFVSVGGKFISYKSSGILEGHPSELESAGRAIKTVGGQIDDVHSFEIHEMEGNRVFVMISKSISTPKKYPRRPGLPAKEPILGK